MDSKTPRAHRNAAERRGVPSEKKGVLGGIALRREFRITLENGGKKFSLDALSYLPQKRKSKIPCIDALNFCGNRDTMPETGLMPPEPATEVQTSRWDYPQLLQAGFAGIPADAEFPAGAKSLFYGRTGCCVREGKHDVTPEEWRNVIEFISRQKMRIPECSEGVVPGSPIP